MLRNEIVSIFGRDTDLDRLRGHLRGGSVLLTGPRRIGKTELLKHLAVTARDDLGGALVDLEGATDVETAVERVVIALESLDVKWSAKRRLVRLIKAATSVSRVEVPGLVGLERNVEQASTWKVAEQMLDAAAACLAPRPLVLMLDVVPWWLDELRRPGPAGASRARAALGQLRYLRQRAGTKSALRMVLTGSVGLAGLAARLDASAEINDLVVEVLGPLAAVDGAALFESEIAGRGLGLSPEVARVAHGLAGGSPHWIKQLAAKVSTAGPVGLTDVDQALERLLDPQVRHLFQDQADEHLRRRHPADAVTVMRAVLREAAGAEAGAPRAALLAAALAAGANDRTIAEARMLELVDEFYLEETADGALRFVNPIFRRWWLRYGGSV